MTCFVCSALAPGYATSRSRCCGGTDRTRCPSPRYGSDASGDRAARWSSWHRRRRSATLRRSHPEFVFAFRGKPVETMNNTAWQSARKRASLPQVRVHDLKHTFGRRLRAAGVSLEDRQDLLGHKSGRITTHYSAAELSSLIEAAEKVCQAKSRKSPALLVLKKKRSEPMATTA